MSLKTLVKIMESLHLDNVHLAFLLHSKYSNHTKQWRETTQNNGENVLSPAFQTPFLMQTALQ